MAETPAPPPPKIANSAATEVASPPLAPGAAPLCYIVDEEASIRHFLSLLLHGAGFDAMEFSDAAALCKAVEGRAPALVFHNISLDSNEAIESMLALGEQGFRGAVQLMSNRGGAVLDHVKNIGIQHKLNMLPVLKKPFETEAIAKIIKELKLGMPATVATRIDLDEALKNNWIEFWYQPKINLRKKQLAGAEASARARHPQNGIVLPGAFLPGATEACLTKLSELALANALKAGVNFSKLGIGLRLTVNIPFAVLVKLPIEDIVKSHHANADKWPGLIVDVPEEQIVGDLKLAGELATRLDRSNVRIAIDNFGRAASSLAQLGDLPFAELKIDRAFVTDCATDKVKAPICKTAIDLAHSFGLAAVAIGIEKASDAVALVSMGCDFGQGILLGQSMHEERFISLLRQRAATQGRELLDTMAPAAEKQPA